MEILKLHDYSKKGFSKEATSLIHGGVNVLRKEEVAKEIAKEPNVECIRIRGKNTYVYAAVKTTDPVTGESKISARIYDTYVDVHSRKHYISWNMYTEDEYMSFEEYEEAKMDYNIASEEKKKEMKEKFNKEKRYVLPTGCHSSILKELSKTDNKNAKRWRSDCKDMLGSLAAEKLYSDSLTNLPPLTRIKLTEADADGEYTYLVKVENFDSFKYPVWLNEKTNKKVKINQIHKIGYEIVERGKLWKE